MFALVINGHSLVHALHIDLEKTFIEVCTNCEYLVFRDTELHTNKYKKSNEFGCILYRVPLPNIVSTYVQYYTSSFVSGHRHTRPSQ